MNFDATLIQLYQLLAAPGMAGTAAAPPAPPLAMIAAIHGAHIHMVPVDEALYFAAAEKYVRVLTAGRDDLIRTPLKELATQRPVQQVWQVHRGTLVRASALPC